MEAGDEIAIGFPLTREDTQKSIAGEVFNAGRAAVEPAQLINDLKTADPQWGNAAERKGDGGTDKIMSEIAK